MILPKIQIKKILYATDLSESARHALAYAVSLANLYGVGITILHVLEENPGIDAAVRANVSAEQWAEIKKEREDSARNAIIAKQHEDDPKMKEILKKFYHNVSDNLENQSFVLDEMVVKRGYPVDMIIETAENRNCDLIVMGTQGHGGLAQMIIGSTAQKVMKRSKIPVLVVRLPVAEGN